MNLLISLGSGLTADQGSSLSCLGILGMKRWAAVEPEAFNLLLEGLLSTSTSSRSSTDLFLRIDWTLIILRAGTVSCNYCLSD